MKKPLVSVLMGVQNLERFVGEAIESVLNQTYENFEFIILDDGSTDKTPEIIAEYAKKDIRIKPYYFKKKQGISVGCNFTLENAKGALIARMDGDDLWHKEKLEKQVKVLNSNSEYGACFSWVEVIDETGEKLKPGESEYREEIYKTKNRTQAEWLRTFFYQGCRVAHPTSLIRKEVFEKVGGYNQAYRQLLDYDLWVRIIKKYQIYVIEEPLFYYRWFESGNVSSCTNEVMFRTYFEMFQILKSFFDDLSDNLFIEAFSNKFKVSGCYKHEELECEKAFILLGFSFYHDIGKLAALELFSKLLNNKEYYKILEKNYNFDTFCFHNIQSEPVFYHSSLEKWPEPFNEHVNFLKWRIELLESENNEQKKDLMESEGKVAYYNHELILAQKYINDTAPELEYFRKNVLYHLYKRSIKKKSED